MRKCDKWNDFAAIKLRLSSPKDAIHVSQLSSGLHPTGTVYKQDVVSISITAPVA